MKESAYNVCARDPDGNYYLFNTRRGVAHVMTACAYESYWAAANRASSLEDATETLRDLIEKGFLPPVLARDSSRDRHAANNRCNLARPVFPLDFDESLQFAKMMSVTQGMQHEDGSRYQIKGRRITRHNKSRQMSAIRDFSKHHFDYLAGILFTEEYGVLRAALIPYAIMEQRAKFVEHTNSNRFILHDDTWTAPGVRDVTQELLANAARSLEASHGTP